jgi:hypothetical protein
MRDTEVEQHRIFSRMKNAVGPGSHYLVDKQKAMEGEDPLKTGMNEEGMGTSVPIRRIPKGSRLYPLVRVVQEGRTAPPVDPHFIPQFIYT